MNSQVSHSLSFPLIEAQSGLWYAQRLAPENPAFNTAHALWINGPLDVEAFRNAVDRATDEALALSLRMQEGANGPMQRFDENRSPRLKVIDLSHREDPEQEVRNAMFRERMTPVDPTRDRLSIQSLYRLGEERYVWYLRVHHLAIDGYGMAIFADRVCAWYAAIRQRRPPVGQPLAPLVPVFEEDRQYRESERRIRDAAYWRETLAEMPEPVGLKPGFAPASNDCLRYVQEIPETFRIQLHQVSAALGQPWPDVLTALTAAYCGRMAESEEAVIGVPYMGRLGSVSARVPMIIMNVLPLRVECTETDKICEFLYKITRSLLQGRRHGRYRSEQMRRDLGFIGGQRRLYGPIVNIQPFYRVPQLDGVDVELEVLATGPVDDVNLGFRGDAQSMFNLEIEANPARYTSSEIAAHATRLLTFLGAAFEAFHRDATLADIGLATPAERQRYLFDVNATEHEVPDVSLVALYEAQMAKTPNAPAVEFEGQTLSYGQLEQRTRTLAVQLRQLGVGSNSTVAVALPRSLELIVALLAIQRAGGAYLPLDLDHPDQRLANILGSASSVCVLANSNDTARFPPGTQLLSPEHWNETTDAALNVEVQPDDAAYVIYTSGSTGQPKGVLIEHRAIVNRLEWMRTHYSFEASDRILQKTPATFDVSVWEFFLPLVTGATLVVAPPKAHHDPAMLARIIRQRAISTIHFVPSMLSAFLASPETRGLSLQRVFCSGEELGAELRDRFHQRIDAELHNLYGPTEAAVDVSYWQADAADTSQPVPIGFPVWNTRLYILDQRMRPVPPGVAGDLYLGGVQLARGYLGRPDLTAERFIQDPFVSDARIYRTGDLARWRDDGAVVFLGRSDHQVKLRGLRIELGEIEASLLKATGVARAEVVVREDRSGNRRLVAYVQMENEFNPHSLRTHLAQCVPDYMVPVAYAELTDWPVTANGKLDRRALPAPQIDQSQNIPLETATEQALAELFVEVLGLEIDIGSDADFFKLGGDSLLAVHLLLAIEQRWQRNPGLESIFMAPSVAGLAKIIDDGAGRSNPGLEPVIQLMAGDPTLPPLFVIHPAGGICWNYRELAHGLHPHRTVYGLQSPVLDPSQVIPESIDVLADDYVCRVTGLYPDGPVHLLGWSVGGIIAHAMAVRLQATGRETGVIALLDAYPSECWRAELEPDPIAALRALLAIAGEDPDQHQELDTREKIVTFLRRGSSPLGHLSEEVLDGVVRAVTGTNRLVRQHEHTRFDGPLLHFRAGRDHALRPHLQSSLWIPYAASVEAHEVPFLHAELTGRDATAILGPILDTFLQRYDCLTGTCS